jgi:peptidyl-dipeptidase A
MYHVAANVPYMRYFLAHVLQFQFQAVLCDASGPSAIFVIHFFFPLTHFNYSGHTGPLDSCSVYGSVAAGDVLQQMLRSGASLPWQDVLRAMTGSSSMSTRPILRYFKPLYDFLYLQNRLQPTSIGWGADLHFTSPSPATTAATASSSSSTTGTVVLSLVLTLIILWVAFKTRRQIRMRQRPIVEFEDMNEFGYSLAGRRFNQI